MVVVDEMGFRCAPFPPVMATLADANACDHASLKGGGTHIMTNESHGENRYSKAIMYLCVDFESLTVSELSTLLLAFRRVLVGFFLDYLDCKRHDENRKDESFRNTLDRTYRKLEESYFAHYRRHRPTTCDRQRGYDSFHDVFDEELFNQWIDHSLRANDIEIEAIRCGSVEFVLSLAAILTIVGYDFDYSMMKDVITYIITRLKQSIRKPAPKDTIEHIPDVIRQLAGDNRVSKLSLKADKDCVDLKVE